MPTFNPDNPQEHGSGRARTAPSRFIRLGWRKVSEYGIESPCGRFRLARYNVPDPADPEASVAVYALWDGHAAVWRGTDPAEGKSLAAELWQQRKQDSGSG